MKALDLTGKGFGCLTVVGRYKRKGNSWWLCKCSCGKKRITNTNKLRSGRVKSCKKCSYQRLSKQHLIDMTGKNFGRWTVLRRSRIKSSHWRCKCECGKTKDVSGLSLRKGISKSCGCLHYEMHSKRVRKDMTGKRFGKLKVIGHAKSDKRGESKWYCECDCGGDAEVLGSNLRTGHTQSCGCIQLEVEDLTGQMFGRLKTISRAKDNKHGQIQWLCECQCGSKKKKIVPAHSLKKGGVKSCGCLTVEHCLDRRVDLTGRRFNKCVVVETIFGHYKKTVCRCKCDCGNEFYTGPYPLVNGNTQSCGCYNIAVHRNLWRQNNSAIFRLNSQRRHERKALGECN